jgi:hypothetical protein
MKKTLSLLAVVCLFVTLVSCEDDSPTSGYSVFFKCDMAFHPFNQITSFGQFITVRGKGYRSYEVTDANGYTTLTNLTEIEMRNHYDYGLGGLIIGTPSMCDGAIWVYDWACPNCDNARYRLRITRDGTGFATCDNCGVVYDLNSGGIPVKGKGRTLWRYKYAAFGTEVVIRN